MVIRSAANASYITKRLPSLFTSRIVPCWVYLLKNYPEYLETLPYLSEYKDTARQPYQVKRDQKMLAHQDLLYNLFIKPGVAA